MLPLRDSAAEALGEQLGICETLVDGEDCPTLGGLGQEGAVAGPAPQHISVWACRTELVAAGTICGAPVQI